MKLEGQGKLLRIFVGESARWKGKPLYEELVRKAREHGLAGATAMRGRMGFGANSRLRTTKILRLSEDLPFIVEIVDREENIQKFLPVVEEMVQDGLVTLEAAHIIFYSKS